MPAYHFYGPNILRAIPSFADFPADLFVSVNSTCFASIWIGAPKVIYKELYTIGCCCVFI